MKTLIVMVVAFCVTGCFGAQYDSINQNANRRMRTLDSQCRTNMTEWCRMQYVLVQRQREQELNDLEARRHAFGEAMQNAGRSMSHRNRQNINCSSQTIGTYTYTNCN